jgi:hypothetical protein
MTCPISSIMINGCDVPGYGDYVLRYVACILLLFSIYCIYYWLSIVYSNIDLSDMYNDPWMLINMYVFNSSHMEEVNRNKIYGIPLIKQALI